MTIAAIIISTLSLVISVLCVSLMLAKNFFSSHQVQMVPVDPFKDSMPSEMGKNIMDSFRDIGDPIDSEELEHIENLKNRRKNK